MRDVASRRGFLALSMCVATGVMARSSTVQAHANERAIALYNVHTDESVKAVFWAKGEYVQDGMDEISHLLRDYRTADVFPIDPHLIDTLYRLHRKTGAHRPYCVVSGYRSPKTNAILRKNNHHVAKNSYHMRGMAVDAYLPKVALDTLHHAALSLRAGGVGYYPKTGFLHLDTGRVRSW